LTQAAPILIGINPMDPLDAFWHLLNLFAPAVGTALLTTAGAKLLWRRELAGVRWQALALVAVAGGSAVTLAGLVIFGRDGRLATYGAMVLAIALTLWWRGFVRRR
jgi:hypothetical protein